MMKKAIKFVSVCLITIVLLLIIFVASVQIVDKIKLNNYIKDFPKDVVDASISENIIINEYGCFENSIFWQYHDNDWGFERPTKRITEKSKYWTINDNLNILYYPYYDSVDTIMGDSIYIHYAYQFPILETDALEKIVFMKNPYGWLYFDDASDKYRFREPVQVTPKLSENQLNELRSLAFTNYEKEYQVVSEAPSPSNGFEAKWTKTSGRLDFVNSNYMKNTNIEFEKDFFWKVCWYFQKDSSLFYVHYCLKRDINNNYYFCDSENGEYVVRIPNEIASLIDAAFRQESIGTR